MTTRQEKVNSLIKRIVSEYLVHEGYEEITGLLTITDVDVSADMGQAKIYFSVIGQDDEEVLQILQNNIYDIQGEVNRKLVMKKLPRIKFYADRSGEYSDHIRQLVDKVKKHE